MHSASGASGDPLRLDLDIHSFSNLCRRLGSYLAEHHGLTLKHTQVRAAATAALGFDSPNALDALLKQKRAQPGQAAPAAPKDAGGANAPISQAAYGDDFGERAHRVARMAVLRSRLAGLPYKDPSDVAIDLLNLQIDLLHEMYPAEGLSPSDLRKVQENSPSATPDAVAERGLTLDGVLIMLGMASTGVQIALDLHPDSNAARFASADGNQKAAAAAKRLAAVLHDSLKRSVKEGLSPYGAAAISVIEGSALAIKSGLNPLVIARLLIENFSMVASARPPFAAPPRSVKDLSKEEVNAMLKGLAQRLDVSVKTARKYLDKIAHDEEAAARLDGLLSDERASLDLVLDHVAVGDFEGAIGLIQQVNSAEVLEVLGEQLNRQPRTARLDAHEVEEAIASRRAQLGAA